MYQTSDIRKGIKIEMDGAPWMVIEFQFVKPGKGQAFTRTRLRNLITGNVVDRTYKTGETLEPADVAEVAMQYLYNDADGYHFMNLESFEQIAIDKAALGDSIKFLVDEMEVSVLTYKGRPVSVEIQNFVELEITYCEPGVKGNTATGATKTATVSTGAEIQVPLFVEQGEVIRIDTRTGEYVGRVR
jgi:elongation factor P